MVSHFPEASLPYPSLIIPCSLPNRSSVVSTHWALRARGGHVMLATTFINIVVTSLDIIFVGSEITPTIQRPHYIWHLSGCIICREGGREHSYGGEGW